MRQKKKSKPGKCVVCKCIFTPDAHNRIICSDACKKQRKRNNRRSYCNNTLKEVASLNRREFPENIKKIMMKTVRKRGCLRCDKKFVSEGPWNRFCPRCEIKNEGISFSPRAFSI